MQDRIDAKKRGDQIPQDILTYILHQSDDLQADVDFNMENMLDEFCTFFIAGQYELTTCTLFTVNKCLSTVCTQSFLKANHPGGIQPHNFCLARGCSFYLEALNLVLKGAKHFPSSKGHLDVENVNLYTSLVQGTTENC